MKKEANRGRTELKQAFPFTFPPIIDYILWIKYANAVYRVIPCSIIGSLPFFWMIFIRWSIQMISTLLISVKIRNLVTLSRYFLNTLLYTSQLNRGSPPRCAFVIDPTHPLHLEYLAWMECGLEDTRPIHRPHFLIELIELFYMLGWWCRQTQILTQWINCAASCWVL